MQSVVAKLTSRVGVCPEAERIAAVQLRTCFHYSPEPHKTAEDIESYSVVHKHIRCDHCLELRKGLYCRTGRRGTAPRDCASEGC